MHRNDRAITDLTTGVDLPQHQMLKVLFERSGLKRNDWHEKAQQMTGRSLGSPTKLSDIFNGKSRSLPMRDIVPYIQALEMRKSETDYYIAEFFKAYCDENLHKYVQSRSKPQQILVLEQRVKIKTIQLKLLKEKLDKYLDIEKPRMLLERSAFIKYKNEKNEKKVQSLMAYSERLKDIIFDNPLNSENARNKLIAQSIECLQDDDEFDLTEEEIEEYEYYQFMEDFENSFQESLHEKTLPYKDLVEFYLKLFLLLTLILRRASNEKFVEFISFCIPSDFRHKLVDSCMSDKDTTPFEFRSSIEITHAFLTGYRLKDKQGFDDAILMKIRFLEYIDSMRKQKTPEGAVVDDANSLEKHQKYFFDLSVSLLLGLPYLENIPKELNGITNLDDQCLKIAISEYVDFYREGLQFNHDLSQLYFLQNPHASVADLQDRKLIEKLINLIIKKVSEICQYFGADNPIEKIINSPDYPHMFDEGYIKPNAGLFARRLKISKSP